MDVAESKSNGADLHPRCCSLLPPPAALRCCSHPGSFFVLVSCRAVYSLAKLKDDARTGSHYLLPMSEPPRQPRRRLEGPNELSPALELAVIQTPQNPKTASFQENRGN